MINEDLSHRLTFLLQLKHCLAKSSFFNGSTAVKLVSIDFSVWFTDNELAVSVKGSQLTIAPLNILSMGGQISLNFEVKTNQDH